ncbi:septum site-determining protein MinC [Pseudothermotoga sp.]|uniref:septum site-determining protein MinC n=1 Tax=Pseudothermotoga sp. TaxID=2033661 RepID=UPI0031F6A00D
MDLVDFKMTKDGLVLVIRHYENVQSILDQIISKLSQMKGFFAAGDKIMLMIERHEMHSHDIPKIISLLREHGIDVAQILIGESFQPDLSALNRMKLLEERETKSGTKVIRKHVRSGQAVVHSGDILVIGNVHAGAELLAGGSIVVFGNVKGTLRAGLNEGDNAVIAALSMQPSLLQISGYTLREVSSYEEPVVVHIKNGKIVVEKAKDIKF